jgi:hypothetical protein
MAVVGLILAVATGRPVLARTNATFLRGGDEVTGTDLIASPTAWAFVPHWQRAVVSWIVVASIIATFQPSWLAVVGFVIAVVLIVVFASYRHGKITHYRNIVIPTYLELSRYIGTPVDDSPRLWITIPDGFAEDREAVIRLLLPRNFRRKEPEMRAIEQVIIARFGPQWRPQWFLPTHVEWSRSGAAAYPSLVSLQNLKPPSSGPGAEPVQESSGPGVEWSGYGPRTPTVGRTKSTEPDQG